ncbi:tetrameric acyl-CoA thioesterase, partial [Xanthomonas perforans]|nr:tetrameric acyl-CoA thioesterase [Xanthomonas perforans]
ATANGEKHLRWFENTVYNRDGEVVAHVRKQLYVKRKPAR